MKNYLKIITIVAFIGLFVGLMLVQRQINRTTQTLGNVVRVTGQQGELLTQMAQFLQAQASGNLGADATKLIAGMTYTMSGSGISSSATSFTLTSFTLPQNSYKIQDADLSDIFYVTLEPGNRTRQELVSCTTVAQNGAGTATLSGCTRGLAPVRPFTASSTLQFAHAGGTSVIFADPPQVFNQFTAEANEELIRAVWNFYTLPVSTTTATSSDQFAIKSYVDSVVAQGAATSTETNGGIVELGTLAEQADSFDGGSAKPTVLQTKNSTSTCQVTGSYNIVASSTSGKLDPNCFDSSLVYTFSGSTTTVQSLKNVFRYLHIGGVNYNFPASNGIASSTLANDSNGNLFWQRPQGWVLLEATTTQANMKEATSTTFAAYDQLKFEIVSFGKSSGDILNMKFNADAAANYGSIATTKMGTEDTDSFQVAPNIRLEGNATTSAGWYEVKVLENTASRVKRTYVEGSVSTAAALPGGSIIGMGVWNNTSAQITRVTFSTDVNGGGSATLTSGTIIRIYGKND